MLQAMMRCVSMTIILGVAGLAQAQSANPPISVSVDSSGGFQGAQAQSINPRYVIQGDTVYDQKADLTWQRCSVGQHWKEGMGCVGVVETFTFDQAQQQAGGGWRVPSKGELRSLIDRKRAANHQSPTIDVVAFPDMVEHTLWYWTSTPNGDSLGWNVIFDAGHVSNHYRSNRYAVRLVRSGR